MTAELERETLWWCRRIPGYADRLWEYEPITETPAHEHVWMTALIVGDYVGDWRLRDGHIDSGTGRSGDVWEVLDLDPEAVHCAYGFGTSLACKERPS